MLLLELSLILESSTKEHAHARAFLRSFLQVNKILTGKE